MSTATLADYRAAHADMFAHYNDLVGRLSDDQLATQSLCPDWTAQGVLAHFASVEEILDGWQPSGDEPPPFDRVGAVHRELAGLPRPELVARLAAITASRLDDLAGRDADIVDAPSFTPVGVATYGRFMQVRLFDMWVHARDISIPLGEDPPAVSGFLADNAVDEVAQAMGYIVGKRIGLPDGKSIVFHIGGGVDIDLAVAVDGRARPVDHVADPDVEVHTDAETFVMLAAGRIDPDAEIDAGNITWTGDDEWGAAAARNLAYTR